MGTIKKRPRKIDFKPLQKVQPCVYTLENTEKNGIINPLQKFSFNYWIQVQKKEGKRKIPSFLVG